MAARRLVVANCKGGVAKTTTAVNVSACLAQRGKRVLLVDYDPQSNVSHCLGLWRDIEQAIEDPNSLYNSADLTMGKPLAATKLSYLPNLEIVQATNQLRDLPRWLASLRGTAKYTVPRDVPEEGRPLSVALDAIDSKYDYIVFDLGPTLDLLWISALSAAPNLLLPISVDPLSLTGAMALEKIVQGLIRTTMPRLRIFGVVGTRFIGRTNSGQTVRKQMESLFEQLVFKSFIRETTRIREAPAEGRPVVLQDPRCEGSEDLIALTDEIEARWK